MRYLLGIILIVCGAVGMRAQEPVASPLPVLEPVSEVVQDEPGQNESAKVLNLNATFDYKQTKEWKNYKILRAVGWSALGLGVPMFWLCAWGSYAEGYGHWNRDAGTLWGCLAWTGAGLAAASIPILVVAYRYRYLARKQMSVSVSTIGTPTPMNVRMAYAPAISLALTF